MLRALPAVIFAFFPALAWAQTAPPPDTKQARERHRIMDKEPPPPSGPWGPEEFGFTWHNPIWRGVFLHGGSYGGGSIGLDLPRGTAAFSDGISPPVFERLEYDEESFRSVSIGATADLDILRLSLSYFDGTFDARATLTLEDGFNPPQPRDVDLHGNVHGFRVGVHWPAFRYRDSYLEASLGPIATVGWMHQEVHSIPGATLLGHDTADILTGSFGPKLSVRAFFGRFALEGDAEYSFMTGAARGWVRELLIGASYKF
jgi:hypothetical protein